MPIALLFTPGVFDFRTRMMGRQAAGRGFLRALVEAQPASITCYAADASQCETFKTDLREFASSPPQVDFVPFDTPESLAQSGVLYRGDPDIGADAWRRQQRSGARSYSLCGITHTLASKGAMNALSTLLDCPTYPWDAVVCTSTAARDVTRRLLEEKLSSLRSRFGATHFALPQFPLIPLGVHCSDFDAEAVDRLAARAALGLATDEVAVLFAGRLTFHAKAHPVAMFLALERAAALTKIPVRLLLFGRFPNDAIRNVFFEEAARHAPSVRLTVIDGAVPENGPHAWAAADIFTSLSDNVQETFGLTPVEAMAAGLPCVVSDWNGYKDTVRDGVDGFRVPVMTPPPGCGMDIADRYDLHLSDYDRYIGEASLFTAVDVEAAARAYRQLIVSPELRRRMGDAGRRRAREVFDWAVVFRRYMALWDELAERRRADPTVPGEERRARRPDRPDPFDLFRSFPTASFAADTRVRLRPGATAAEAVSRKALKSVDYAAAALPGDRLIARLVDVLASHPDCVTLADLAGACAPVPIGGIFRSIAFLAKMGIVEVVRGDAR